MVDKKEPAATYPEHPGGRYPVEEALRAQQEQPGVDGKTPVHEAQDAAKHSTPGM